MNARLLLSVFLIACFLPSSPRAGAQPMNGRLEITPFVTPYSYSWKEFDDNGSEDLHESGLLVSAGANARYAFMKDLHWFGALGLEFYSGTVDYTGFVFDQQGNRTPYSSKTGYFGYEFSGSSGYDLALSGAFSLTPTIGLGMEGWKRSLDNGGPSGYDEHYTVVLAQLGLGGSCRLQERIELLAGVMLKIPLSISESVDLSRTGAGPSDLSFSPGSNPRYILSSGGRVYGVSAQLLYESWTLGKSGEDRGFLQPQSSRTHFGVRLGYTFSVP